jgi:hypothetical protein
MILPKPGRGPSRPPSSATIVHDAVQEKLSHRRPQYLNWASVKARRLPQKVSILVL